MKLSANPGALRFMRLNQLAPNRGEALLGELPFRDIYARTDVASESAIRVKPWYTIVENPAILSIFSPQPVLQFKRLSSLKCSGISLQTAVRIVRMNSFHPTVAKFRLEWAASEVQPRLVDVAAFAVRPGRPDHYRCAICNQTETPLALAQLGFSTFCPCPLPHQPEN